MWKNEYILKLHFQRLKGYTDFEGFDQSASGVVDADAPEEEPEADDEVVEGYGSGVHGFSLQLQVEVAGPNEAQHRTGEAANEAHQNRKVGYKTGHEYCKKYNSNPPSQAPNLQLPVQGPNRRKRRFRFSAKERPLQKLAGGVIRQRIAQERFNDKTQVYEAFEPGGMEVVRDDLLRIVLEREEADVAEERLEDGGPDVRPVQHPLELGRVLHVALKRRQEDLRRVREDDHAETDREVLDVHRPAHLAPAPIANL